MASAFELLSDKLRGILPQAGLESPNETQEAAIPRVLAGESVLLIAPTGAGKTEAALLPVLDRLVRSKSQGIRLLYVTPLRALNRDVERRIAWWAGKLGLRVEVRHGDTPPQARRKQALKPPDILVTTPETLQAILPAKVMRRHLGHVKHVIIDEVHQLAKDRRGIQLATGLERLAEVAASFQRIGLSATVGNPEEVAGLFGGAAPLEVVSAAPPKQMTFRVEWPRPTDHDAQLSRELFISPEVAATLTLLDDAIEAHAASLVFVNSRNNAELLGSRLLMVNEAVGVHHGSLPREAREKTEAEFKSGKLRALVCTSTLELGIDVGSVEHALQYMSPRQVVSLVQRTGRAGHSLGRVSKGTIVAASADDVLESLAIIRRAERGALEPRRPHTGALDVLAHQIAGIVLDNGGRARRSEAVRTVARAWPYRDPEAAVERVAGYLAHLGLLRADGGTLAATRRTRDYYYRNLSTIRDERSYPVVELASMQPVGILGEEEMALRARRGVSLILRGRTWKIVEIAPDGRVFVDAAEDPTARIPGWDGELLPLPFEVAQETARLRAELAERLSHQPRDEAMETLASGMPASRVAVERVAAVLAEHLASGAPVPSERLLLLEAFDNYLLLHAPFGEVVNETLADVLEERLADLGLVRFWWRDGHRILLELTRPAEGLDLDSVRRHLFDLDDATLERLLRAFLSDHFPLGFYMKAVAERFGALPRGLLIPADELNSFQVRFRGTPVEEEATREALLEHTDMDRVREVFRGIRTGALRVAVWSGKNVTPLGYPIVRRYVELAELLSPDGEREQSVQRLRQFLETEHVALLCFECGNLAEERRVSGLPDKLACGACASRIVAPLSWHGRPLRESLVRWRAGDDLPEEDAKDLARNRQGADLVAVYGKKAVIALSVYGVGPQAAARILAKMHRDESAFYRELYEAKLRFVATRPFWQGKREPTGKAYAY